MNTLKTDEELQNVESEIRDRFGELPTQVVDLLDSVRIKWMATQLGLEKVIMKKGKITGYFISNQQSRFYQSTRFTKILQFIQSNPKACTMKEKQTRNGLRLLLTFENIATIKQALTVLQHILA